MTYALCVLCVKAAWTPTFFALDPDFAAHELHKGLGHRQAQPAAAVCLRHTGICLRENLHVNTRHHPCAHGSMVLYCTLKSRV